MLPDEAIREERILFVPQTLQDKIATRRTTLPRDAWQRPEYLMHWLLEHGALFHDMLDGDGKCVSAKATYDFQDKEYPRDPLVRYPENPSIRQQLWNAYTAAADPVRVEKLRPFLGRAIVAEGRIPQP